MMYLCFLLTCLSWPTSWEAATVSVVFSEGSGDTSVDDSPETGLLGESQKFSAALRSATWFHDDVSVLAENYVASHKYSKKLPIDSPIGGFPREIENYLHGVPKKIVKSASKCQTSSL